MSQFIAAVLAIAKALPILDKWMGELLVQYAKMKNLKIEKEIKEAVDEAINTGDQRPLESQEHSGQYSGHGDIRDSLPGVHKSSKD